jgi:putative flippase GtrA
MVVRVEYFRVIGFAVIDFLKRLQRRTFVRGALTSSLATAADFVAANLLHALKVPAAVSTILGCIVGGVVAFSLNRNWAFHARAGRKRTQLMRFGLVWGGSALLNAAGVSLFLTPDGHFTKAWLVTRGVVYLGWNYPLLRYFVFRPRRRRPRAVDPAQA